MPLVSVIIPCYNEKDFIGHCLDTVVAGDYPTDRLEVLVVDGMSTDGTRGVLGDYVRRFPYIRMIDNLERNKPRALNLGIGASIGSIVIRLDAHAAYAPDYVSRSVAALEEFGADNVGGVRTTAPQRRTLVGRAIARSVSHRFSAGNATYRTGASTVREVDTVFGGCYRRDVFERIGTFNEALLRGQDREFNARLRRAGGRILLDPAIRCEYFARSDIDAFCRWVFVGGETPIYISRITGQRQFSWRNFAPMAAVVTAAGVSSLAVAPLPPGLRSGLRKLWAVGAVGYAAACLAESAPVAKQEQDARFMVVMPAVFVATHVFYGLGSLWGLVKPLPAGTGH